MAIVFKPQDPGLQYLTLSLDLIISSKSSYQGVVTGFCDGDTIDLDLALAGSVSFAAAKSKATVRASGLKERVRLLGIDTPELHSGDHADAQCKYLGVDFDTLLKLAKISQIHLQFLCPKGTKIILETTSQVRDDYGRILAGIYLGDLCINQLMVEHGYAITYQGYSSWKDYGPLEDQAKADRRGIWGQCEEEFYPVTTSTKTYHRPGCTSAPKSGVRTDSVKEARDSGLKPCSICMPDFSRI